MCSQKPLGPEHRAPKDEESWFAAIENHCRSSKRLLKPNLKEGLKRTAGGECVRRLSWSLSWWF